jgi:two-component sensor histidine kinase
VRYIKYYPTLQKLNLTLLSMDTSLREGMTAVIDTAVMFAGAQYGNLQFANPRTHGLRIMAHHGFDQAFIDALAEVVKGTACIECARTKEPVVVTDVKKSAIFDDAAREALDNAKIRAVISVPVKKNHDVVGVMSVHFKRRHKPIKRTMILLDLLASQAAAFAERKFAEQQSEMLLGEVQHRINNMLAVIQAIAHRSPDRGEFHERLAVLARSANRLVESEWRGVSIRSCVSDELSNWLSRVDIKDHGNAILRPQDAQNFHLALHELTTNAIKYGALSNGVGRIQLSWGVNPEVHFEWKEIGGPPVAAPDRKGFGSGLLHFSNAKLDYEEDGLRWKIALPADGEAQIMGI